MIKIGGLQKVSLIDYPGRISAVVFTQGCNFRCSYCHNPDLVDPKLYLPCLPVKNVLKFLALRVGKLDAVTLSGGEPTLQDDLVPFLQKVQKLGFALKLDTNGSNPQKLVEIFRLNLLNFIAMDVKAPMAGYSSVVNSSVDTDRIRKSIQCILQSGIPHEFRTTVASSQLTLKDISTIAKEIKGAKRYVLQKFRKARTLAEEFSEETPYSDDELLSIKINLEKEIPTVIIR
jgi:pyruvate formate lyase activating enzyme